MTKRIDMTEGMGDAIVDESDSALASDVSEDAGAAAVVIEDEAGAEFKKKELPRRARRNDDGSVSLPLLKPVALTIRNSSGQTREETIQELVFHELTGADMRIVLQQSETMKPVVMLARATRIATNRMTVIFDRMVQRDISAATDILTFLSE